MTDAAKVVRIADDTGAAGDAYDDIYRATLDAFKAEIEATGCSVAQASREIGRGAGQGVLSLWMREKYEGDVAGVTERVRRWVETRRDAAERSTAEIDVDRHLDLDVTLRIQSALAVAQARGDLAVIYGPSGTGKTTAVEHYCEERTAVFHARMLPDVRTLSGLLSTVAGAIGQGDEHKSASAARKVIVKSLAGRGALLVVDECHHLSPLLLDMLRCLRDLSGAGVAFVGEEGLEKLVYNLPHRRGPIVGRVAKRVAIKKDSLDPDVGKIAASVLGRDPGAAELQSLVRATRGDGGLHVLRRLLERAYDVTRADDRARITARDVALAAKGWGDERHLHRSLLHPLRRRAPRPNSRNGRDPRGSSSSSSSSSSSKSVPGRDPARHRRGVRALASRVDHLPAALRLGV